MFHVEFVLRDPSVGWSSVFRSSVLRLVIGVLVIRFSVIPRCLVGPFCRWSCGCPIGIPRGIVGVSVVHVEFVLRGLSFGWWSLFRWFILQLLFGVSVMCFSFGRRCFDIPCLG